MHIQIVKLKNVVSDEPYTMVGFRTVVEETPLCSYNESVCPEQGEHLLVDGRDYVVRDRRFIVNTKKDAALSVIVRCYPLGKA